MDDPPPPSGGSCKCRVSGLGLRGGFSGETVRGLHSGESGGLDEEEATDDNDAHEETECNEDDSSLEDRRLPTRGGEAGPPPPDMVEWLLLVVAASNDGDMRNLVSLLSRWSPSRRFFVFLLLSNAFSSSKVDGGICVSAYNFGV